MPMARCVCSTFLVRNRNCGARCRAVTGVIRAALVRDTSLLSKTELEDRIVILIRAYVSQVTQEVTLT